jgi:hypothetical protein
MAKARTIVGYFPPRRIEENMAVLLILGLMVEEPVSQRDLGGIHAHPLSSITLPAAVRCTTLRQFFNIDDNATGELHAGPGTPA